jgi:hypothetical protein
MEKLPIDVMKNLGVQIMAKHGTDHVSLLTN